MAKLCQVYGPVEPVEQVISKEDIAASYEEVDSYLDDIDIANESLQTLSAIENVFSRNSTKGISDDGAKIATIAVESICSRLGLLKRNLIVANECFTSDRTRVAATSISLESIGEFIAGIFKAIAEAIKKLIGAIMSLFGKTYNAAETKAREIKLEKTKEEIKEQEKKDKEQ